MATPSVTYSFSNSTVADATEVNTNFADLINALTDGTSDHAINTLTLTSTLTANGNVTLGNASSDTLTVNATPTFAAATTFSNSVTVTGTANLNGDVNIGDGSGDTITVDGTTTFNATTAVGAVDFSVDTDTLFVDASADRVGINTSSPAATLEISADNPTLRITDNAGGAQEDFEISVGSSKFKITNVSDARDDLTIDGSGNVGINTSSPDSNLVVADSSGASFLRIDGATNQDAFLLLGANGTTYWRVFNDASNTNRMTIIDQGSNDGVIMSQNANSWSPFSSDQRLKESIETIPYGLKEVKAITPSVFYRKHWSEERKKAAKEAGYIAQNVQANIPEMAFPNGQKADDGSDYLTIDTGYMIPVLHKAIQEQQAIIEKMQAEIDELKK